MDERDLKLHIYKLVREYNLEDSQILETLNILSVDLDTIRRSKACIENLNNEKKALIRENVIASLRRRDDLGQMNTSLISTFIGALLFSFIGILFDTQLIPWFLLGAILVLAVFRAIERTEKHSDILTYKLIVFIENLKV